MTPSERSRASRRQRVNVALRCLLALFGAYALASLAAAALAVGLPLPRLDAAISGVMLGFVIQLLAVLWVFAAPSVAGAAHGLAVPAAACALWLLLVKSGVAP